MDVILPKYVNFKTPLMSFTPSNEFLFIITPSSVSKKNFPERKKKLALNNRRFIYLNKII